MVKCVVNVAWCYSCLLVVLGFLLGPQVRRGWSRDEGDEAGSEEGGESSIHGNGCEGDGATLVHLRECFKGRTLAEGKTAKSCKVVEV